MAFIGEIQIFGGNYAPGGWAFCDGQLLSISQNSALFSLIGTTYGGDGRNTFALPDLRGRVAISDGSGPGLTPRQLGEKGGQETVALSVNELPTHRHGFVGAQSAPTTSNVGTPAGGLVYRANDGTALTKLAPQGILNTGGSLPHQNDQPYTTLNYIICLDGIYPSFS